MLDGEFETLEFDVGSTNEDTSSALIRVFGRDQAHLDDILAAVQAHGAVPIEPGDAELVAAPADGVLPDGFYSTTNLETCVRIRGTWIGVGYPEMDCGVRVDEEAGTAETVPMGDVGEGDLMVVGPTGVRVTPLERSREAQAFEFMSSEVSSEKPKAQVVREVARVLRGVKERGGTTIWVVGPAVVHTGAAPELARIVESGFVNVLFGGNAVAVHDIEAALFGTSLGVSLKEGVVTTGGHEHHIRALNTVRALGGIAGAVDAGVLTSGLMRTCVATETPFVLAGSIRDDGPLPDVLTDIGEAQTEMRRWARRADACVMLSSMLHAIAVGNLLPASVHAICVDINPAVVTKLADRGSFQTTGIVTDVGLFVRMLADELARG
jgi:lysine-ketoglutarate reductase/saccharopine dehydrogenase-like protein (TIGR00300 family)